MTSTSSSASASLSETTTAIKYMQFPSQSGSAFTVRIAYRIYSPELLQCTSHCPVVLICGWRSAKENWFDFPKQICQNRSVIVFDNRGVGDSKIIFDIGADECNNNGKNAIAFTMTDLATDIAQLLTHIRANANGADSDLEIGHKDSLKFDIIGGSMGGMIALQFALLYPRFISRLFLMCASPAGGRSVPFMQNKTRKWFKETTKIPLFVNAPKIHRQMILDSLRFSVGQYFDNSAGLLERHLLRLSKLKAADPQIARAQMRAIAQWNVIPELHALATNAINHNFRILIIHGTEDNVCDIRNSAFMVDKLHACFTDDRQKQNITLCTLEKVGHSIWLDPRGMQSLKHIIENDNNGNNNCHAKL